jgi:hypothetical protein
MGEIVSPEGQSVLFFHFWVIFVQIAPCQPTNSSQIFALMLGPEHKAKEAAALNGDCRGDRISTSE